MGRYFTDEVIDEIIKKWEETYPGAIERAQDVMKHPYRDNDKAVTRSLREFYNVLDAIPFRVEYSKHNPDFDREMSTDVFKRMSDMMGPVGTDYFDD